MFELKTVALFVATAIAEIVGCYLPWLWLKQNGSILLLIAGLAGYFRYQIRRIIISASRGFEYDLRNDFFAHLERLPLSELVGASDFPSLWNQKPREGLHLHWDGDNDSVDERNLSAGLGAGITPVTADHANIKRVRDWIWTLPPPKYP